LLAINITFLGIFLVIFLFSLKNSPDYLRSIDNKEHKLYILYPMADGFLRKTGLEKLLNRKNDISTSIQALYITNKPELIKKLYWCRKISMIFMILAFFSLLSILGQIKDLGNTLIHEGRFIERPEYGQGSTRVELSVTMEQAEGNETSETEVLSGTHKVSINVQERAYTQEELDKIFEEAIDYLKANVLGNNKSADCIYGNLNFCNSIPGTSISVKWHPKNYSLIQSDGTVMNEDLQIENRDTTVTAILAYHEQKKEHDFNFTIMQKQYSEAERLQKALEKEIIVASEKTAEEEYLELPTSVEKYRLLWEGKKDGSSVTLFFFGIILAIVVWLLGDKEIDKQMKKRKEQMLIDYPEIINKFTLLINAGMTVKQAWNKIGEDYRAKSAQKKFRKRYAYEEMLTTSNELKLGFPENLAYEQYGRRIGLIPYIKFSSLISQNLKKGNKGFTELLMKEAIDAFEDRKEIAKRLGEEAGTKLLMPMMLMLIIVFLIIMIPAFWSFKI
jgi:tight adherence protein C